VVDGVTKTEQRVLTVIGAIVGALVGFVVFQKVIGNRMIEAPKFVLAVFLGGVVGMVLYTLIKDGGIALLKRRSAPGTPKAPPAPAPVAEVAAPTVPAPATKAVHADKAPRRQPLRAKEPPAPDPDEKPRARPVKATRERPLRPPPDR
jgi:hypothetical protein